MQSSYSIVSLRRDLSTAPIEEPFAVIVEAMGKENILVLVGKNPSPEGWSVIGREIASKAKELLHSEIQRALESKPTGTSVLDWLAQHHRWSFYVSKPAAIAGKPMVNSEIIFGEAFKLFVQQVIGKDVVAQAFLRRPLHSASTATLTIPTPEFAEAFPVGA
ncbi:MAG: hypothetical protein ACREI9_05015 [Nitrospiraceae bacterium]